MESTTINELLQKEITPTTAINILIGAVDVACKNPDVFTETDRALISKALTTLKSKVDEGENFMIQVKE